MPEPLVDCPKCGKKQAYELAEEVDIGVGVQRHVYGYDCKDCGMMSVCSSCGVVEFSPHASWCKIKVTNP